MQIDRFVMLLTSAVVCGCASTDPHAEYLEREPDVMAPYEQLAQQKAELWELGFEPQEFEFEGQGKVTVSEWALTGWPGNVYVNARVTYENTTDQPVQHAIVWLEILDSTNQVAGASGTRLMNPLGYALWPGHTFTLTVRTPTNDAHLDPNGWQWGVACKAVPDPDPGNEPVLVVTPERAARGEAPGNEPSWQRPKDPNWRRSFTRRGDYYGPYYRRDVPVVRSGPFHTPGVTRF